MNDAEKIFKACDVADCSRPTHIKYSERAADTQGAPADFILECVHRGEDLYDEVTATDAAWDYFNDDRWAYESEAADGCVPIYTQSMWMIWVDLKGYNYDNEVSSDVIEVKRDEIDKVPQIDLWDIARKIIQNIINNPEDWGYKGNDRWK
jgi:hypothetical protein